MPTVLRVDGFKFFFYANDHAPMHVHVIKNDNYAKINFITGDVLESDMKKKDISSAVAICKQNKNHIKECWNEWFAHN